MGSTLVPCEVLVELMLDPRSPERSGRRLIEWAVRCGASGVVLPCAPSVTLAALRVLCDEANRKGLRGYVEASSPGGIGRLPSTGADGYFLRHLERVSPEAIAQLVRQKTSLLLGISDETAAVVSGWRTSLHPAYVTLIYMGRGGHHRASLAPMKRLTQLGWCVGYTDNQPDPWCAVSSAFAGARVILKALTLNRSLGGAAHQGSLYPHECWWMVERIRQHEMLQTEIPGDDAAATGASAGKLEVEVDHLESLVLARSVNAGDILKPGDLTRIPELRGVSARMEPHLMGKRLLYHQQPGDPVTLGILEPWVEKPSQPSMEISVVIRSKNEDRWLRRCLSAILNQSAPPKEVIVIDNDSTDDTRSIAAAFGCRLLTIRDEEFSFGRALNRGIAASRSAWVVSLSAHCIPLHDLWLAAFARECDNRFVAAVYGKQEPLPDTNDFDKRDLWTTFGQERRVQQGQDYFFHNANSLIRKAVWETTPFNEELSGVEDRDWAKRVLADGYQIVYAPMASVHHHHGIHQGRNEARAKRVVKVIEFIQQRELVHVTPFPS